MATRDESIMSQTTVSSGLSTLQQVTGQAAFWALLPLALNAMGQHSSTATAFFSSSGLTDGMLIPHLSSPVFAAMDCILDLVVAFRTLVYPAADTLPDAASSVSAKADVPLEKMTIRLLLFLFGVLPQAIRIFGMKGIQLTQALAAILISTSIARMLSIVIVRWTGRKNDHFNVWLTATDRRKTTTRRIVLLLHIGLCFAAWFQVSKVLYLDRNQPNETVRKTCDFIFQLSFTITLAATLYWILGMYFCPLQRRKIFLLPISPVVVLFLLWPWLDYPDYLLRAGDLRLRCKQDQSQSFEKCIADRSWMWDHHPMKTYNTMLADSTKPLIVTIMPLCIAALIGSWALAVLLTRGSKRLSGSLDNTSHDVVEAATEPSPQAAGVVDSLSLPEIAATSDDAKNIFGDDDAATHGLATIGVAIVGVKPRPNISDVYQQWIAVSYSFHNFRRTLPKTFIDAWTGTGQWAPANPEDGVESTVAEHESPTQTDATQRGTPEAGVVPQPKVPRSRAGRLLWWLMLFGGIGSVQMLLFMFFAAACLFWDFWPVYRAGSKLAKRIKPGEHWVAFAIFNLATAAVYYFLAYDGHGTVNPSWTNLLNR